MSDHVDDPLMRLSLVAGIHHPAWRPADWRERFAALLADGGFSLSSDADRRTPMMVSRQQEDLGFCLFEDAGAVPAEFTLPAAAACPYAGELLGWFKFEPWGYLDASAARLLGMCCRAYATLFARRGEGCARPITDAGAGRVEASLAGVSRRAFPLDALLSKYGFDDGGALLDCEGPYRAEALVSISDALRAAGVLPDIGEMATGHNPFRFIYYVKGRFGKLRKLLRALDGTLLKAKQIEARLAGKSVELWAFTDREEIDRWMSRL